MRIAITATPAQPQGAPLLLRGDLADAFRQAAQFGCQGVEIHMRQAADVDLPMVQRLQKEYGLEVPTVGTGMAATMDGLVFSSPDCDIRARAVERVRGHIEFAAAVGSAVTIGIVSGKLGSDDRETRRAQALECLAAVCGIARQAGVTILIEPLNRYECDYINSLADGCRVIADVGAPNLKLLADTFHMNIEEPDLAASFAAAAPCLGHVHLADTNREAPGHGHLDVAGVLAALDRISYQGYLSFEVLPLPDPCRAIRDGLEAVRAAMHGQIERK